LVGACFIGVTRALTLVLAAAAVAALLGASPAARAGTRQALGDVDQNYSAVSLAGNAQGDAAVVFHWTPSVVLTRSG
jgi:hypothetical protein